LQADSSRCADMGLIFIDVDGFKSINTFFGHANADLMLIRLGEVLHDFSTKHGGMIFHISGDEFLALFEKTKSRDTLHTSEALVKFVWNANVIGTTKLALEDDEESKSLKYVDENSIEDTTFSISAGCADYKPGLQLDEWITRADNALAFAKISGRNAASHWIPADVRQNYTKQLMSKLRTNSSRNLDISSPDEIDLMVPGSEHLPITVLNPDQLVWEGGGIVGTASLSVQDLDTLIRKGADVNYQLPLTGETPLHLCLKHLKNTDLAIWWKHAKTLASLSIDVDLRDKWGITVLHYATSLGLEEVALCLADKRHNPLIPTASGKLVLDLALDQGFYDLARKELELGAGRLLYTKEEMSIWFEAVREGSTSFVKEFLDRGWNPNIFDLSERTALFLAVYNQNEEMIMQLVNAKANVNARDYRSRSILMDLVGNWGTNRLYFVNLLVKLRADPMYKDKKGRSMIHHLVMNEGSPEVINQLINLGVDPLAVDKMGNTAMDYAANEIYMNILSQQRCLMC